MSIDPIRFEFTFDEASLLRYERLAKDGKSGEAWGAATPVTLRLIDEKEFSHQGQMDFVDNVIDRASGTIRGRAVFANATGLFTPGMFGRVRVPGSPAYEALLVPDAAIGTEQARKFVLVVGADNTVSQKYVTLGDVIDELRVIKNGLAGDDRVIVNGLMRARPGGKVTPQAEARPAAAGEVRREQAAMKISHFFIDRPIFASVVSIVFVILGRCRSPRLPVAQYPEIAPPIINVTGQYPGASADTVAATVVAPIEEQINGVENMLYMSSNSTARRPLLDRGDLRSRHQSRYRAGAGAEPRGDRAAAPAAGRAPDRRHRAEELARPDDGRASLLARQVARPAVHLQLRHCSRSRTR